MKDGEKLKSPAGSRGVLPLFAGLPGKGRRQRAVTPVL